MFVRQKRSAPARRKKSAKGAKGRKAAKPERRFPRLPEGIEQRHLDLLGLFLLAASIYLIFVLFAGWEGGKVGYGLETALFYLFGSVGARIFVLLMLVSGCMLLTGTSVSALARGIGRGLRAAFTGGADATRTAVRTHADWREERQTRRADEAATVAGPTDVLKDYPEDDEGFEPTVALADEDELDTADFAAAGIFDRADDEADAEDDGEEPEAIAEEPEPEPELLPDLTEAPGTTPQGNTRGVTVADDLNYIPPPMKALERGKGDKGPDPRDQEAIGRKLIETLAHFRVEAKIVGVVSGPHVSLYEMRLAPGIKVKKVTELAADLAYALASTDIRILAPIPGKQAVGVEVPNTRRRMVRLGDIYAGRPEKTSPLVAWLGKGIDGNAVWTDLAKMPHVLVAGTTGSGKSGCINAILSSILMQASPNDVR
ncbi:MAG: DNA translocase FtsK, partial [Solirubrobacterales bacterium]